MQISNNIEIVCGECGASVPVDLNVGREPELNRWIFRVMPCRCQKPLPPNAEYRRNLKALEINTSKSMAELKGYNTIR